MAVVAGALAMIAVAPSPVNAQRPDSVPLVRRALERFDRSATIRVRYGSRTVSGQVTRLTPDSVYVQGFDWPAGVPLARVDTLWERIPGGQRWKVPAMIGAVAGGTLAGLVVAAFCGQSETHESCVLPVVVGVPLGAVLVGGLAAFVAGLGSTPARWERRFP